MAVGEVKEYWVIKQVEFQGSDSTALPYWNEISWHDSAKNACKFGSRKEAMKRLVALGFWASKIVKVKVKKKVRPALSDLFEIRGTTIYVNGRYGYTFVSDVEARCCAYNLVNCLSEYW